MNLLPLIETKRAGEPLSSDQITDFVRAAAEEDMLPEQLGALLMAICLRGLDARETRSLTLAMRDSGCVLSFPQDRRPLVDKHSTGGVGDKVSLALAPLLAALGCRVPMISGRGLGITGGTLDKMESIPGLRTQLTPEELVAQVQDVGCVICGQTSDMVPADRTLYAMRDVTGTIASIPLITSSILSKKLAEGIGALILDVKVGAAAFMTSLKQARELASAMTLLGRDCGLSVRAVLTDMDTPLGHAAGNWLEVKEVMDFLNGRAPADLKELVTISAAHLLELCGQASSLEEAREQVMACLETSAPRKKFEAMIRSQGADLNAFTERLRQDSLAPVVAELKAPESGFVQRCNARLVGEVVHELGGGRTSRTDRVHHDVGVDRIVKPGTEVESGAVLARVHARETGALEQALHRLATAFSITRSAPDTSALVLETIR